MEQVSEERLWISIPGVVQESDGCGLEQLDLVTPVLSKKLDWWSVEVPFNLSYNSVIKFLIHTN